MCVCVCVYGVVCAVMCVCEGKPIATGCTNTVQSVKTGLGTQAG